jgi:uncharacterized protein YcaQ
MPLEMARTTTTRTSTGHELLPISVQSARRLALASQSLDAAGSVGRGADAAAIEQLVRKINYVQLDPIAVVARSPLLVLWARIGCFAESLLDECLFTRRDLFEFWAHAAAIVPTSDLALYRWKMRRYPLHSQVRDWMAENAALADGILAQLADSGPLPAQSFVVKANVSWKSSGWTEGRDIDRMLTFLWRQGRVVVAGRSGGKRIWQLSSQWFPAGSGDDELDDHEIVRRTVARSLIALGAGTVRQAGAAFDGWGVKETVADVVSEMVAAGEVLRVAVGDGAGRQLKGDWLIHSERLEELQRIEAGEWEGRSVLLSPFDNLIIDRSRSEAIFDFEHRMEIYVPAPKRRWGYYVLPYLHGDRFAGRIDLRSDRKTGRLVVLAAYAEPWAARPPGGLRPLRQALERLAKCCGLDSIAVEPGALAELPATWSKALS